MDGTSWHLYDDAIAAGDADRYFIRLHEIVEWRAEAITLYGKRMPMPRLVAWYGDVAYGYSGIRHLPKPWLPELLELRSIAETLAQTGFNSVLLNLYRDGRDSMGWHADDEKELGPAPVIASLSLGAERRFQVRRRDRNGATVTIPLTHGSCLVMQAGMQREFQHQIPKTARVVGPRINLTFRMIGWPIRSALPAYPG